MRSVLGIDAAWTLGNPSGVALVAEDRGRWRLRRVASSYAEFLDGNLDHKSAGFDAVALVSRSAEVVGSNPTLVAADIPLSKSPITGRRASDDAVSFAYGARHASTHTPSIARPGPVSERIRRGFEEAGYELQTKAPIAGGLIEVYPHPALIELSGAARRLPYKEGKIRKYWPDDKPAIRAANLLAQWEEIVVLLDAQIDDVRAAFDPITFPVPRRALKAREDAIDAVVCAWVGVCALEGHAVPLGDAQSAIWIPSPRQHAGASPSQAS